MRKPLLLLAAIGTIVSFLTQSCKKSNTDGPVQQEFVAGDSSFTSFAKWQLAAVHHGPDPLLAAMAHANNDTTVTRYEYFKNGQNPVNGLYPEGTIIVKHSTNAAGTINELTAMVKRGGAFNQANDGWEWFMLNPDGTIATDSTGMKMRGATLMNGMCGSCHNMAGTANDFVFAK